MRQIAACRTPTLDRRTRFWNLRRMRILSYGAILAAMCCPLDAYGAGAERFIPDCAGAVEIPHARVLRVDRDGTLVSSKGQALRLEGIRLPLVADKAVYDRSQAALRALALSGT